MFTNMGGRGGLNVKIWTLIFTLGLITKIVYWCFNTIYSNWQVAIRNYPKNQRMEIHTAMSSSSIIH